MILAVTGATGFLGRHFVARALESGHTVRALVRAGGRVEPGVEPVRGDLADAHTLDRLLDRADTLVHLAAHGVQGRDRDWHRAFEVNATLSLKLLQRAHALGVSRAVTVGTCLEYQGHGTLPDAPIDPDVLMDSEETLRCAEDSPLKTAGAYDATKAVGGEMLQRWARGVAMPLWYLRMAALYGAGDHDAKFLPSLLRAAHEARPFEMSAGEQWREWLPVGQAADAVLRAACVDPPGAPTVVNVGTGHGIRLRDLAARVMQLAGRDPSLVGLGAVGYRGQESHVLVMDVRLARDVLGWASAGSLDEGIAALVRADRA